MRAPASQQRRRPALRSAVPALLVALLLAGCAGSEEAPAGPEPSSVPPQTSPPAPPARTPAEEPSAGEEAPAGVAADVPPLPADVDPAVSSVVDAAVADLSGRLGVASGTVEVLGARPVTWPDASLGCPEEGMAYAQVLTEGAAVELSVGGTRYRYHAGDDGDPFPCEEPTAPVDTS